MDAPDKPQATAPEPIDPETAQRRQALEDAHEDLLLTVMALEAEWLLDDRIAYALRHQR